MLRVLITASLIAATLPAQAEQCGGEEKPTWTDQKTGLTFLNDPYETHSWQSAQDFCDSCGEKPGDWVITTLGGTFSRTLPRLVNSPAAKFKKVSLACHVVTQFWTYWPKHPKGERPVGIGRIDGSRCQHLTRKQIEEMWDGLMVIEVYPSHDDKIGVMCQKAR